MGSNLCIAKIARGYGSAQLRLRMDNRHAKRKETVWHGGIQQGVTTLVYLLPKEHFALVVLMNLEGEGVAIENFGDQIADIVLQ